MQKLQSIQCLRAIAASAVIIGHCGNFALGSAGVDLFFVISGFVIASIAPGQGSLDFLKSRMRRIYPIYFVYLLPWAIMAAYLGILTWPRTLASLTLWPIYGDEFARSYLKVAWTLSFEMLFYLAAAVALRLGARPVLYAFAVSFVAFRIWPSAFLGFLGNPMVLEFLAGVVVAKLPRREAGGALLPIGLLLFALSSPSLYMQPASAIDASLSLGRAVAWGFPSALVVYGALCLERFANIRPLVLVGDASYTIYLSHLLLILFLRPVWYVQAALLIGLGVGLYVLIERPLLKYTKGPGFTRRFGVGRSSWRPTPSP